ncbi:MAG: DUF5658 family protein [Vicinamibacterales bacterium]
MRNVGRVGSFGAVLIVLVCTHIAPASAQDGGTLPGIILESYPIPEPQVARPFPTVEGPAKPLMAASEVPARRPSALMPLYGTLAVLQGLDMHSTMKGIGSDGREANPFMKPFVSNGAAFLAVKTSATLGVIWMSERVWRKHRKAAVVSVFVVNAVMAAVVANNYGVK